MGKNITRWIIYLSGMVVLALGITLNAKAGLGASAIVSVPYTFSKGLDLDFANLTLITYCFLVLLQFIIKGKEKQWVDLLQIVVSLVFTRFMSLFSNLFDYHSGNMITDILVLLLAIVLTGIGAAMTVDMKLIPNPGDGIVSCISEKTKKRTWFMQELCGCDLCMYFSCRWIILWKYFSWRRTWDDLIHDRCWKSDLYI